MKRTNLGEGSHKTITPSHQRGGFFDYTPESADSFMTTFKPNARAISRDREAEIGQMVFISSRRCLLQFLLLFFVKRSKKQKFSARGRSKIMSRFKGGGGLKFCDTCFYFFYFYENFYRGKGGGVRKCIFYCMT